MAFGIAAPLPYEVIGYGLLFVDMAIAMYDLDKFKRINDMYGHPAGDEALVAVSEAVRPRLCEDEILVRWGVAECSKENYQETIKHADTALYRAKNMGRNRVVMYFSEMDSADNDYCG